MYFLFLCIYCNFKCVFCDFLTVRKPNSHEDQKRKETAAKGIFSHSFFPFLPNICEEPTCFNEEQLKQLSRIFLNQNQIKLNFHTISTQNPQLLPEVRKLFESTKEMPVASAISYYFNAIETMVKTIEYYFKAYKKEPNFFCSNHETEYLENIKLILGKYKELIENIENINKKIIDLEIQKILHLINNQLTPTTLNALNVRIRELNSCLPQLLESKKIFFAEFEKVLNMYFSEEESKSFITQLQNNEPNFFEQIETALKKKMEHKNFSESMLTILKTFEFQTLETKPFIWLICGKYPAGSNISRFSQLAQTEYENQILRTVPSLKQELIGYSHVDVQKFKELKEILSQLSFENFEIEKSAQTINKMHKILRYLEESFGLIIQFMLGKYNEIDKARKEEKEEKESEDPLAYLL